MTAHNPVEVTGNIIVHHPVAWTPAPAPCRFCGRVHRPGYHQPTQQGGNK